MINQNIKKLATFEKIQETTKIYKNSSKSYKSFFMKKRVNSHIKTIQSVEKIAQDKKD